VRDSLGEWGVGSVVSATETHVVIRYKGWSERYNESLPRESPRLAEVRGGERVGAAGGCWRPLVCFSAAAPPGPVPRSAVAPPPPSPLPRPSWAAQLGKYSSAAESRAYKVQGMQFTIGMGGLETMMNRIDDWISGSFPEDARERFFKVCHSHTHSLPRNL
jgi:hypothetical protein